MSYENKSLAVRNGKLIIKKKPKSKDEPIMTIEEIYEIIDKNTINTQLSLF